ncbi:unnamed protein product, partial [Staurois parvus]
MAYSWWELDGNTSRVVRQAGSITTEQTVLDGRQRILRSRAGFSNGRSGKGLNAESSLVQAESVTRRAMGTTQELATGQHTGHKCRAHLQTAGLNVLNHTLLR